jgi:hypothetical protein
MDASRLIEWMGGLVSAKHHSPNSGVGERHTQIRKVMGRELQTTYECIEWQPPYRARFTVVEGPIQFEVEQIYETLEGATQFTMIVTGEPGGYFAVAAPLLVNQLKRDFEADFGRLKTILEGM